MKRIGVITSKNGEGGLGIPSAYAQYFSQYGTLVPINALDDRIADVDIIILQGGADVDPRRYGQKLNYYTQNPNIQMEIWDTEMLPQYIQANIPIFAVCRGFQSINVHFGGQLSQNIYQEYSDKRADLVHGVTFTRDAIDWVRQSNLYNTNIIKDGSNFKVNSLHHQGFTIDQCAPNIMPILTHTVLHNVEAFGVRGLPIAGVQWHPEEIWDTFSSRTIKFLLDGRTF